jgi:hypothetical protein
MFLPLVSLNNEVCDVGGLALQSFLREADGHWTTRGNVRRNFMNPLIAGTALFLFANSLAFAQLTIDNPKHLDVPQEKAKVLLRLACRTVAKEFHSREQSKVEFDFRLVLGEKEERYGIDDKTGVPTLYLQQWNETKFATAAIRLAVQKSVDRNREERMISDILQRSEQIVSIPANKLRGVDVVTRSQAGQVQQGCLGGIRDASQRDIPCGLPAPTLGH